MKSNNKSIIKIAKQIIENYNELRKAELSNGEKTRRNRVRTKKDKYTDSY